MTDEMVKMSDVITVFLVWTLFIMGISAVTIMNINTHAEKEIASNKVAYQTFLEQNLCVTEFEGMSSVVSVHINADFVKTLPMCVANVTTGGV